MYGHRRSQDRSGPILVTLLITFLFLNVMPIISAGAPEERDYLARLTPSVQLSERVDMSSQMLALEETGPWYLSTSMDLNGNMIFDAMEERLISMDPSDDISFYIDFKERPTSEDLHTLQYLGVEPGLVLDSVHAVGVRTTMSNIDKVLQLPNVVMLEPKGEIVWYSDVATAAVKAKQSDIYRPVAWDLGFFGAGSNIAVVDTGIDNEHESLEGKFVAGVDMTKPDTIFTPRDGTYDPNDVQGHGSTCAGIATGTGGPEQLYQGVGIQAKLVDVRIGTKIGYGIGELLPQEFYDSAVQGLEWCIQNADNPWSGTTGENQGIDILSLSWGIDVGGSSDGSDVYSRLLDRAVESGIIVSNAAGNSGPDNVGFDGMAASSLSIKVGATDDQNTIPRDDDEIAEYSSRGPRDDNGDDDPYNELIPDVCAPGTNINNLQPDTRYGISNANGYGPRGSGTSYATPVVSGLLALMIEANPNLDPAMAKEVLRFTAQRRGDASAPDLDPFWNRDFGWGIIDGYEAVKFAMEFKDIPDTDIELQCFFDRFNITGNISGRQTFSGLAWARTGGAVEGVEVRIGDGDWRGIELETPGEMDRFLPWSVTVDTSDHDDGNLSLQARAIRGDMYSLADTLEVPIDNPDTTEAMLSGSTLGIGIIGVIALGVVGVIVYKKLKK